MPEILARLRVDGIGRYDITLGMRVYLDGGFYAVHHDDNVINNNRRRKLNFVYFFHRKPRRFSGGDLLLHDASADAGAGSSGGFSRFVPLRNSIVFFPSACLHEVTPVQCGTNDFGDGRWVVNGHVVASDGPPRFRARGPASA